MKKLWVGLIAFVLASMPDVAYTDNSPFIWNGTFAKNLAQNINLRDNAYFLTGTADPTVSAQNAPKGSLYLRYGTSYGLYQKTDNGSSTNWVTVGGSATAVSGPGSSTDNAIARWDGTTGVVIQNSSATIDDSGNITATNLSGTNTGNVTLAAVGSSPNANGASLSGQVLNLQPATASFPGALTAADWATFNNKQSTITIGSLDAQSANSNGLSLVSNVLSTQSATASSPGLINTSNQSLGAGNKYFSGNVGIGTTSTASKLDIVSTTSPQESLAYDGTNKLTIGESSTGTTTFTAAGTTPYFTFTGANVGIGSTTPASTLVVAGSPSVAAWTTSGVGLTTGTGTYTDTSSSGTVALQGVHAIRVPTVAASSSTTFTDSANLYIAGAPTAGSGVTQTNAWAEYIAGPLAVQSGTPVQSILGTANTPFRVFKSATTASTRAIQGTAEYQGSSNSSSNIFGFSGTAVTAGSSSGNVTVTSAGGMSGARNIFSHAGTGTVSFAGGQSAVAQTSGSNNSPVTDSYAFNAENPSINSSSTWGTQSAFWARGGALGGGAITTRYGLRIDDLIGGTARYGIYQTGTSDKNVLAGNTTIGAASDPATTLDVRGVTTFGGNIIAGTDNTYDIGASGATRPRTEYLGTSLVVGPSEATVTATPVGSFFKAGPAYVTARNSTNAVEAAMGTEASAVWVGSTTNHVLNFMMNNLGTWSINTSKHFVAANDNLYDIGASGANRPRTVYVGTSVVSPTFTGALTGNASTATALAANPTDCAGGQFANAIDASGNLTCAVPSASNPTPTTTIIQPGTTTYNLKYAFAITSGSATAGATYTNNAVTFTVAYTVSSGTRVYMSGSGAPASSGTLTKASGTGDSTLTFSAYYAPTYLEIIAVGGGGGGAGSGTATSSSDGADGADTTFSTFITAGKGLKATFTGAGGAGGAATVSSPAIDISSRGGASGNSAGAAQLANVYAMGGAGAGTPLAGGGAGGGNQTAGGAAVANTGAGGGGGGGASSVSLYYEGSGGGASAYVSAIISAPSASYACVVGAGGAGGGAGTSGYAGGAGGSGIIVVKEFYN